VLHVALDSALGVILIMTLMPPPPFCSGLTPPCPSTRARQPREVSLGCNGSTSQGKVIIMIIVIRG
jgi:hypothetical protein